MVHRSIIQCPVCRSKILVRTQIGFLPDHPIRIHCGQCGILIEGAFTQDESKPQFSITFDNAEEVEYDAKIDYCIEVSGEFLTEKIKPFDQENDFIKISPFMKAVQRVEDDIENFQTDYLTFHRFLKQGWPQFRQMNDLWLSDNHQYLKDLIRPFLPAKQFPLNNDLELLRGLHILQIRWFNPIFRGNYFDIISEKMFGGIREIVAKDGMKYFELIDFFVGHQMLDNFERDVFKILHAFIRSYKYFVIALSLECYSDKPNLETEGTATVTFDDVKYFFQDCFECIGELAPLAIAYNNAKYRSSFREMAESPDPSLVKVKNIDDLLNQTKSNRLKFCLSDEVFNQIIELNYSSELRNVIGHLECFQYEGASQCITYYPSCVVGKGDKKSIYLVDFLCLALKQFRTVLLLNELVYQTKKMYFATQGQRPVNSNVFETDQWS